MSFRWLPIGSAEHDRRNCTMLVALASVIPPRAEPEHAHTGIHFRQSFSVWNKMDLSLFFELTAVENPNPDQLSK